ncbi:ParB/Srx family N-terminal domain-containing protein [Phascolarctobacterium faecium]|uniref:ParB/Srx family N-terminal domain-containing protein n=1 Tax=Phascolarctobacterium faecium TaxID=33025 RepID=UPI00242B2D36|nr:ParB/Srx family N-terminal domain-containing protein [Phascolarctobacterium faecium]
MKVTEVSIDKVILAEKSVRMHTEIQVKEFARSLEMFGQIRPIVVDGKYNIVCGNGLYLAAQSLGWAKVKVLVMNKLSEKDKKKLMIADNRIFELGVSNLEILDEFFKELQDDLVIPGYDESTLQMLVGDLDAVNAQLDDYGIIDKEKVEEIKSQQAAVEQKIERVAAEENTDTEDYDNSEGFESNSVVEDDNGRYVICPKCGEKVWL